MGIPRCRIRRGQKTRMKNFSLILQLYKKVLNVIYISISQTGHYKNVKTNVTTFVKLHLRYNQDTHTPKFQTVPQWQDVGYFNEWFIVITLMLRCRSSM